ncbi:MAG: type II secretion system F family protein, partial [Candidatus Omnitrophica bacterium]|nr:type II secretion system F family protein [Candidatus Omnitrophota bacterium]
KVILDIQEGKSLSDALSSAGRSFSLFYINMIKAAEASGNLVGMFKELSQDFTRQRRINRQVQAAFMYPVLVLIIAITILTILLVFIIPIFVRIFEDLGGQLPPATVFLIGLSRFLTHRGWLFLVLLAATGAAAIFLSRKPQGRYLLNNLAWHIPLFGKIAKTVHIGRFCRMLGTLLSSGINLVRALEVLGDTSTAVLLEAAISDIRLKVEQGASLSESMEETGLFSLTLVKMAQIGEESGKIADLFLDAAEDYEEEVSFAVSGFLSLLEPVLIVIMGVIVGFIVVALFFPIFTMSTLIQ